MPGHPTEGRQMVILSLHSACHDASRFPEPETIRFDRDHGRQLAFGAGTHYCLGASLARVIIVEGLATLATRFPDLALNDDASAPVWDDVRFGGIISLPVRTAAG